MIEREAFEKRETEGRRIRREQKGRIGEEKQREKLGGKRRENTKERRSTREEEVASNRQSARIGLAGTGANTCHSEELLAWMNHLFNFDDLHFKKGEGVGEEGTREGGQMHRGLEWLATTHPE